MTRKSSVTAIAALLALTLTGSAFACIWDRDTIETEKRQYPGVLELITGKFVRHSPDYYAWRVRDREQRMKYEEPSPELFDDLAVGYEKLGDHEKAIALMLEKEKQFPGLYETRANLGTFYIHDGQLERGLREIELAIEINPDAHFGREIYQKHLVKYVLSKRTNGTTTLPLDRSDRSKTRSAYGFAHYILQSEKTKGSGIRKTLSLQKAQEGVMGMMRFGNHESPILLEALADVLASRQTRIDGEQMAATAYLKASREVKDDKSRHAYHNLAEQCILGPNREQPTTVEHVLSLTKSRLEESTIEGEDFLSAIERNEQTWIAEGRDVDIEFSKMYYVENSVPSETPAAASEQSRLAHHDSSWRHDPSIQKQGRDIPTVRSGPVSDWNGDAVFLVSLLAMLIATVLLGMFLYSKDRARLRQSEQLDSQGSQD